MKQYQSAAEKQRAYRDRKRAGTLPPKPPRATPRPKSRPQRLAAVEAELRDLSDGYRHWFDGLPENLAGSQLAADLEQIVDQLENLADEVAAMEPPRGFGR